MRPAACTSCAEVLIAEGRAAAIALGRWSTLLLIDQMKFITDLNSRAQSSLADMLEASCPIGLRLRPIGQPEGRPSSRLPEPMRQSCARAD